jgi:hypothetical protein
MALTVSILGTLTTLVCALFLLRQFAASRQNLLLWSGLCFAGLTVSNVLLCLDPFVPGVSLYIARLATAAGAMCLLVYGLVWEGGRP